MALVINTNVASLNAQRNLRRKPVIGSNIAGATVFWSSN